MKKPLNILAAALLAGTVFSSSIPEAFAKDPTPFTDVNGTEYSKAVQFLYDNGFSKGISPAKFGIKDSIRRVDTAMILGKYFDVDRTHPTIPKAGFRDLPARSVNVVSFLKFHGIMNGKTNTYFGAGDTITRGEAAIMFYNAFAYQLPDADGTTLFTDVSPRYKKAVQALVNEGVIRGISNTKFGTNDPLTRGQLALLLYRLSLLPPYSPLPAKEKHGFVAFGDSNTSGSYFDAQFPESLGNKWTNQVAAVYGEGMDYTVYNAGKSGNNTEQAIARFEKSVLDVNPKAVTIMFGINDALLLNNGQPQVSKVDFKQNLARMVFQLKARDIKVVLMTNPPVIESLYYELEEGKGRSIWPLYKEKKGLHNWINSYNDTIRQVAKEQLVPIVDVHNILIGKAGGATDFILRQSGLLDDLTGIHMTPKANAVVAEAVKEALAENHNSKYPPDKPGIVIKSDKEVYDLAIDSNIKLTIVNASDQQYHYSPAFTLQKKVNNNWSAVPYRDDIAFLPIMMELEPNKTVEANFSLDSDIFKDPLTAGDYRIVQYFTNTKNPKDHFTSVNTAAEFKIIK